MKSTALLLEKELGESEHQRKCRIVYEWIVKKQTKLDQSVTRQMLMSSKQLSGGAKQYDHVLNTLLEEGRIEHKKYPKQNDWEYFAIESVEKN